MPWWKNPVVIGWLSIITAILVSFVVIYFQSERFASKIKDLLIKAKLYIYSKRKIIITISFVIILVLLLVKKLATFALAFYALVITILVYLLSRKRKHKPIVLCCNLGDLESETGKQGLQHISWDDGDAVRELYGAEYIRRTEVSRHQLYIYFAFAEDAADQFRDRETYIIVEYLDNMKYGNFHLHYDSSDKDHPNKNFKGAHPHIVFTGSNEWKTGVWKITDGNFRKSQQGNADFRLRYGKASSIESPSGEAERFDIYVRKVVVATL